MPDQTQYQQNELATHNFMSLFSRLIKNRHFILSFVLLCSAFTIFMGIWLIMPRSINFSYANASCIRQPIFLPNLVKNNSDTYNMEFTGGVSVSGKPAFTTTTCVTPKKAPNEDSKTQLKLSLFNLVPFKSISVNSPAYPSASLDSLEKELATQTPLPIALSSEDKVFNYSLVHNDKTTTCSNNNGLLECDISKLSLVPGTEISIGLDRLFNSEVVESVFKKQIKTLDPINIIGGNATPGSIIYDQSNTLTVDFDKQLGSVEGLTLKQNKEDTTQTVEIKHEINNQQLVITPSETLVRKSVYILEIPKALSTGNHSLLEPYSAEFTVSGGPKVVSHNTGSYAFSTDKSISIKFDQTLHKEQDLSKLVSVSGEGVSSYKTYADDNYLIINPSGNLPSCIDITITISAQIQSNYGISGDSGWSHTFRTLCRRISSIGTSVQGRPITANWYGNGPRVVAFIGGIHGNETSSINTMNSFMDNLERNSRQIPSDKTIVVIPNANPDGYALKSRFNANGVDLNRNFPTNDWRNDASGPGYVNQPGRGGNSPLSEPEAQALANFVNAYRPRAVFTFHSAASLVSPNYAGDSAGLAQIYAQNSPYSFANTQEADTNFGYNSTGDFEDWMAQIGIVNVIVEHKTLSRDEYSSNKNALWAMVGL